MAYLTFCPGRMFETSESKEGVCDITPIHVLGVAAAPNVVIIPAVASKRIVVVSGVLRARTVQTDVAFFSNPAGVQIHTYTVPAVGAATPNVDILPQPWGAFVTTAGQSLCANFGAGDCDVSLMYYYYVP